MDMTSSEGAHEDGGRAADAPQPSQQKTKPLRFVTNYGAPHPKRRRIGAACLTCRKRKTACSGERPTCETCKQNKLECTGYRSETTAATQKHDSPGTEKRRPSGHEDGGRRWSHKDCNEQKLDPQLRSAFDAMPAPAPAYSSIGAAPPMDWLSANQNDQLYQQPVPSAPEASKPGPAQSSTTHAQQEPLFSRPRDRMPYFRWLGPTAIMPGFKQMVVKVKRQETDTGRASTTDGGAAAAGAAGATASPPLTSNAHPHQGNSYMGGMAPNAENGTPLNLPFYDTSLTPPSELITHLANTFFTHLGCNYPFLQRERFLRDLEEKQVDAILVDAVCAIAARFSTHPLLTGQTNDDVKATPAEYGHAFAHRAQSALIETFPCPSVAAVQAALLLAYVEFGESRDSGLWMYLGISIRMAQDLGLHKIEGLRYRGKTGPTPKMIKRGSSAGSPAVLTRVKSREKPTTKPDHRQKERTPDSQTANANSEAVVEDQSQPPDPKDVDEQKAVEQERVDTFWAVFFLDRMVSSGTGRRSTLRDKDIELSFPALDTTDPKSGWPAAFPALIRIVHLYGRMADLLNTIKEPSDITLETPRKIALMESQVTEFYQGLSPKLHFDAINFQHYMKIGEGTNFVLLHFWFHTLIVLLHQPTLFKTFEGNMLQLFPNSQQLSMSSAKTIADILSYSQLMDAKASLGNPFTTQPIYIAACAFLKETAAQTASSTVHSRANSPAKHERDGTESQPNSADVTPTSRKRLSISALTHADESTTPVRTPSDARRSPTSAEERKGSVKSERPTTSTGRTEGSLAKHTLLAKAASQHYQLCYEALLSLETYWAGTKYILTVLNQKFEGVGDPLLYTAEEGECSMERPRPEPSFTSPGWRRKLSLGPYLYNPNISTQALWMDKGLQMPGDPGGDLAKAIGWTLTGTMNSPSTNLAWHYPSAANVGSSNSIGSGGFMDPSQEVDPALGLGMQQQFPQHMRTATSGSQPQPHLNSYPTDGSVVSSHDGGDMLMQMNAQAHANGTTQLGQPNGTDFSMLHPSNGQSMNNIPNYPQNRQAPDVANGRLPGWAAPPTFWHGNGSAMHPFGDMMIESQDIDTSMLGLNMMMPWFDNYPAQDMAGPFDPRNAQNGGGHAAGGAAGQGASS
ncbi:uncharacterized protein LTR77_008257 [Saxophila tyrrhenica]|uniref:Zn(2)-C6 fungal-type domain-containing protein n=1 Tax=Saxophila tyrrhenica TaxID=1690608 RepID=A0AAV9P2A1_9PEZI|nr:hypothetical protein LTR77_008257 [Saxophila tyrrhenica]